MRRLSIRQTLLVSATFATAALSGAGTAHSQVAAGGTEDDIVVTAQKRDETLREVPISITVKSGEELAGPSITSLKDALRTVPGISGYENPQAAGMTKFSVRGVASNGSLFNGAPTVGYYLDETPFGFVRFPVSPDANAYDLERVEVLRGPQGTLYGANSLNGVVRVITKAADLDDFEATGRATISSTRAGGENYRGDAAVNVPIIPGQLAVRVTAGYSDYSGWIDQPAAGRRDSNDSVDKNLRVKVKAAPVENLTIEASTWLLRGERGGPSYTRDGNREGVLIFREPTDSKLDMYGLTVSYDFPTFSVLSSTSHIDFQNDSIRDNPVPPGTDQLLTVLTGKVTSQEVRLVSTDSDSAWKWSLGGIYRDAEDSTYQDFLLNRASPALVGEPLNIYTSKSFAFYGEITRKLFDDKLQLTAGLRYFEDKSASNEVSVFAPAVDTPFGRRENKFTAWTPRAVITYLPSDDMTLYASYSQGFRSGFAQNGQVLRLSAGVAPEIRPDRLHNYEIGMKGRTPDGVLSFELAGYYIDWKDTVQVLGVVVQGATFNGAINSKGVSGFGVDASAVVRLTPRFSLDANFSWNGLTFDDDVLTGSNILYRKGTRINESPELTAGGGFSYVAPLGGDMELEFSGSANYSSFMYNQISATLASRGDNLFLARSALALRSKNWTATLFVENLTDEKGAIRRPSLPADTVGDRYRPRTIGLQLDLKI